MLLRDVSVGDTIIFDDKRVAMVAGQFRYIVSDINENGIRLVVGKYGIPTWYKLDADLQVYKATC
jgi:hypothetical protein